MFKSNRQLLISLIILVLAASCQMPPADALELLPSPTKADLPSPTIVMESEQAQSLVIPDPAAITETPINTLPTATQMPSETNTPRPTFTNTPTIDPIKPILDAFIESVKTGNPDEVVGVHVEGKMMLKVIQQPPGEYSYVTDFDDQATEFILAYEVAGNLGLIAHNYLAGDLFFDLQAGNIAQIIYGDGTIREYIIEELLEYQALNPYSTTSDFVNLASNERISATNLFYHVYGGEVHHLTFQTCIERNGSPVWGRFFAVSPEL